jgi:hypothetical protein
LKAQPKETPVSVVAETSIEDGEARKVLAGQRDLAESLALSAHETDNPRSVPVIAHRLDAHRLVEERASEQLSFS